eukprot:741839_1
MGKCLTIEIRESDSESVSVDIMNMNKNTVISPTTTNSEISNISASRSSKKSQIRIDHDTLKKHIKGAMSLNQQISVLYEEKAEDWLNIDTKLNKLSHIKHNNTPVSTHLDHIDLQISLYDIDIAYIGYDKDPEIDPPSP